MLKDYNIRQRRRLFTPSIAPEPVPPPAPDSLPEIAPEPFSMSATPSTPTPKKPRPKTKGARTQLEPISGGLPSGKVIAPIGNNKPYTRPVLPHSDIMPGMQAADKKTDYYANREEGISWAPHIAELKEFYKTAQYDNGIRLDKATVIEDTALFIETNLSIIQAYEGNRNFLPALDRLKKLKRILETKPPA